MLRFAWELGSRSAGQRRYEATFNRCLDLVGYVRSKTPIRFFFRIYNRQRSASFSLRHYFFLETAVK